MDGQHESGPLSAEAEIVRVRSHLHDMADKVDVIAVANANVARDVAL